MPSEGKRLHGFTVASRGLATARQLLLPAIIGGASAGDDLTTTLQWIVVFLTLPSIALAFAQWLAFRYRLEGDDLIIHSGVLSRRRRVIPVSRLQNIDLEQSALERLAGVARLEMETASGGAQTEASLAVLSLAEARAIQADLLRRRVAARTAATSGASARDAAGEAADATAVPGVAGASHDGPANGDERSRPLLRLSTADLAIAGATSNEAGLIAAALATGLELFDDLAGVARLEALIESAFEQGATLGLLGALAVGAGLVIGVIVLGWILSVVVTVIRYHGFTLTRAGGDLRREYGLFSRHHSTVPLERVQAVRIEESFLRRPLGLVSLKIETAGANPRQRGGGRGESEAFVPIARRAEVGALLRAVFEDAELGGVAMHPVSPVSRRRSFVRLAIPVIVAALAAGLVVGPRWFALGFLLAPAWLYARADYRARAWGRPEGYALVRGGVFTRVSWVVPERKIQTLHILETPFQRRLDLGTLLVDTAAGGRTAGVVDLDRRTAVELLDALARDAETARRQALRSATPAAR